MTADYGRPFRVKTTVSYTAVDGETRSIAPGTYWIEPVWAEHVPASEAELECWIVKEKRGAEQETAHDVDAETVDEWRASGGAEFG